MNADPSVNLSSSTTTTAPSTTDTLTAVPTSSRKHPPGYHPPRAPRRPARKSSLRAAKALRSTSAPTDEVAAAPDEVAAALHEEDEAIRGAAQAIASACRPIHSRRQSVLLQEAQDFLPADINRASRRSTISPIDAAVLQDKNVPASKITYRLSRNIDLDYGEYATNEYSFGNYVISKEFADEMLQSRHRCRTCNRLIKYQVVGFGAASTFTGHCRNRACVFDKIKKNRWNPPWQLFF